ncbi:hypothetical protein RDABS01_000013 [Bienertia sinuspersici]
MANGLEDKWKALSLTAAEEDALVVEDEADELSDQLVAHNLAGKLLSDAPYNPEALKITMSRAGLVVREIENNIFVFQFFSKSDREKVLEQGPWSFDGKLLLLKEVNKGEQPAEMTFNMVRSWVKVYQLPVDKRRKPMAMAIANKMGSFVEFDGTDPFDYKKIHEVGGVQKWVDIRYEKQLLDLCVICGMFGHVAKDCAYYDEDMPESMYPYGAWLRASPTRSSSSEMGDVWRNDEEYASVFVDSVGRRGGLGLLWRKEIGVKGLHAAEGDWRGHWLCAGDFNQFLYKEEKMGGPMREQNLLDDFTLALEDCGLLDLGYIDFPYTWWNGRDEYQIVHERLDRMLGNSEWLCYFPLLSVYHLNWGDSDHVPVKLTEYKGGKKERRRGKGFKFEDFSLTSNACGAVVEEAWGEGCGVGVDVVPYRLGVVSAALKRWSKKEFGSIQEQLKNKRSLPSDDVLVWHYSSNGESYTTKSGYRFIRWFKVNMNQASSSTSSSFLWKKTWSLVLLPKVKVFLWRSCRKALPTRANRISGKPRQCAQCDRTEENVLHALFLCLVVQGVCESISVDMSRVMDPPNERFNEWWEKILKLFTDEEICKIAMICWGLWDARNKSIFVDRLRAYAECAGASLSYYAAYVDAQPVARGNAEGGRVGDEGVVARDEHGEVLVAAVNQIEARWEPRVAEAKDVLYAIKVALFSGFDNIVVETDCLDVIKHLQEGPVEFGERIWCGDAPYFVADAVSADACETFISAY